MTIKPGSSTRLIKRMCCHLSVSEILGGYHPLAVVDMDDYRNALDSFGRQADATTNHFSLIEGRCGLCDERLSSIFFLLDFSSRQFTVKSYLCIFPFI